MKRRILVLIVLLSAAAALWWRLRQNGGDPNVLVLHGNVELTEVDLSFKLPGRLLELAFREGDLVKAGAVLARLDQAELERTRDREAATRELASSNLAQLLTGISYQKEAIDSDLALRKADVAAAEARLRELETGSRPQEIEQARAALTDAEAQHAQARADFDRAQRLFKNDDISRAQFDQFRTRFDSTAAVVQRTREAFALVKEGPRKEQIDQARAAADRARAAVRLAEAARIDLRRREQELGARRADVARAEAQLKILDTQIDDRVLRAPLDAVVLTKSAEQGEVLAAGSVVATLGDLARPFVRAYVSESDLGRVKIGQTARLRTDSYPAKSYEGRVSFISSQAEFTPKQIQTEKERVKLVYRVKIETANPAGELKNNMPVDVELRLDAR
jgi:HlyD family secretion protein